ncbi:MarR family winged helix-turn-helix transcriptional regulator [Nocardioides okcheonensis]|uniref:MarR family winged helix-turn-helix transcriptional regulator n=1 Tax=Nocardioides okcheonensis TaxID=2894081 RepID=UPI001E2D17C9|nr:MarR family winged helix-turn-helix transcriptional regulator [Nocardioides okcheonensis]UFN46012.1 MarR family winged helix-turn-helix transcriptional regulator [Nocardioides okcheonensis]
MTDDLSTLSSDLVVLAARLTRAVRREIEHPAGVRTLSLLDEMGPSGVTALAAADRCSQPTMTATVKALREQGLVERRPHPTDGRAHVVALSDAGRADLARIRRANADLVTARLADTHHTAEEVATAVAVLRDVLRPTPQEDTL